MTGSATLQQESEFPYITAAYSSTDPGSTKGVLLVRDKFGHSTRQVDYAKMEAWFSEHHPSVFTTDGGKRVFNLGHATPAMLTEYFEYDARSKPRLAAIEYGCLVDPERHFGYANSNWGPAVAAGLSTPPGTKPITGDLCLPHGVPCRHAKTAVA